MTDLYGRKVVSMLRFELMAFLENLEDAANDGDDQRVYDLVQEFRADIEASEQAEWGN